MGAIIDTHVFFWLVQGSNRLSPAHRVLIEDRQIPLYVSAVTGWEVATKSSSASGPKQHPFCPDFRRSPCELGCGCWM